MKLAVSNYSLLSYDQDSLVSPKEGRLPDAKQGFSTLWSSVLFDAILFAIVCAFLCIIAVPYQRQVKHILDIGDKPSAR